MAHSVLIQNGAAWQVWENTAKVDLPPMHPSLVEQVIEYDGPVSSGWLWDGAVFTDPTIKTSEQLAEEVRAERDRLLIQSDWTQLPDAPVEQVAWAAYRQALRDITAQSGFPIDVLWPAPPS